MLLTIYIVISIIVLVFIFINKTKNPKKSKSNFKEKSYYTQKINYKEVGENIIVKILKFFVGISIGVLWISIALLLLKLS